jgi:hypothetical protein
MHHARHDTDDDHNNELMRVTEEAKKLYYQKLISNSENKIQLTWEFIDKETWKKTAPDGQ